MCQALFWTRWSQQGPGQIFQNLPTSPHFTTLTCQPITTSSMASLLSHPLKRPPSTVQGACEHLSQVRALLIRIFPGLYLSPGKKHVFALVFPFAWKALHLCIHGINSKSFRYLPKYHLFHEAIPGCPIQNCNSPALPPSLLFPVPFFSLAPITF